MAIARRSDKTDADQFADDFIVRLQSVPRTTPSLRAELKRISKEIALLNPIRVLRLAHDFIHAGIPRFVAYELVLNHKQTIASIGPAEVERLGEGINGWADIDTFSCFISGPVWRAGRIPDSLIQLWARSDDWRWRRVALVSTVPLNSRAQGGTGDVKRTLDVCSVLIDDRKALVVKAMSWALRELAKREPGKVRLFLSRHEERLAPLVIREVRNKLETGRKNPRRASV